MHPYGPYPFTRKRLIPWLKLLDSLGHDLGHLTGYPQKKVNVADPKYFL